MGGQVDRAINMVKQRTLFEEDNPVCWHLNEEMPQIQSEYLKMCQNRLNHLNLLFRHMVHYSPRLQRYCRRILACSTMKLVDGSRGLVVFKPNRLFAGELIYLCLETYPFRFCLRRQNLFDSNLIEPVNFKFHNPHEYPDLWRLLSSLQNSQAVVKFLFDATGVVPE